MVTLRLPFANREVVQVYAILFVPDPVFLPQTPVNAPFGSNEGKVRIPGHEIFDSMLRGNGTVGGLDRKMNLSLLRLTGYALDAKPFPFAVLPIGQLDAPGVFVEETELKLFLSRMNHSG